MKVENITSSRGNKVANQFVIRDREKGQCGWTTICFQSYDSIIVRKRWKPGYKSWTIELDRNKWDYSKTTGKYRNLFLGETKSETQKKIDSGEYILTDLNS